MSNLVRSIKGPAYDARYFRLKSGEKQTESMLIGIPVHPASAFIHSKRQQKGLEYATNIAIELGYFKEDLPGKTLKIIKEEAVSEKETNGIFKFFNSGEEVISRDDEIIIGHVPQKYKNEQILRTTIDDLNIPYIEKEYTQKNAKLPKLDSYTKIEIKYLPSMLDYFFPYASQRSLLSPEEIQYLQNTNMLVVENPQHLEAIVRDISKTKASRNSHNWITNGPIRYRRKVDLKCYNKNNSSTNLSIYNGDTILIDGDRLICYEGLPSLKMVTPKIQNFIFRIECAENLKNLWYRLQLYNLASKSRDTKKLIDYIPNYSDKEESDEIATMENNEKIMRESALDNFIVVYPEPSEWCDEMLQPFYPTMKNFPFPTYGKWNVTTHICPGASDEGKNHYAMNPNCEPNSPGDMVLLFETKAGWNQHDGPESFTFDNHDPKGGCVLLNDGTVKFIRTKEELNALKWK